MRDELRHSIDVGAFFGAQKGAGTSGSARSVMEADLPAQAHSSIASAVQYLPDVAKTRPLPA